MSDSNVVLSHFKIVEKPFPQEKVEFRTYVPDYAPNRAVVHEEPEEEEVETKVVRARRGRRPKAAETAETK